MKQFLLIALAISCLSFNSRAHALSLTIENESEWEVHELYFSPVDQSTWGDDQLRDQVIKTEGSFTLKGVPKDKYDVKIVDEEGDQCIINDVDFRESEHFVLTDKILLGCQKNSVQEDDEEEDEGDDE